MDSDLDALLERTRTYSAFADHQQHLMTSADLDAVVAAAQKLLQSGGAAAVTVWNDATGDRTEVEPQGGTDGVRQRLEPASEPERRPGPGRPRLGVVAREVSLLPRHWDWLAGQPGGASAALRRLVDEARKRGQAQEAARVSRDAAAKAMSVLAGDQPGFEEALRALYRAEFDRLEGLTAAWPDGLRRHALRLTATADALHRLAEREARAAS